MAILKFSLGLNLVDPAHELMVDKRGFTQCTKLQNYTIVGNKITKIGGTEAYNSSVLDAKVPWLQRNRS